MRPYLKVHIYECIVRTHTHTYISAYIQPAVCLLECTYYVRTYVYICYQSSLLRTDINHCFNAKENDWGYSNLATFEVIMYVHVVGHT